MNLQYSFRVPASTSNLGAGFDALSLALQRYLRITLELPSPGASRHPLPAGEGVVAKGVDAESIPTGDTNLILRVANHVAQARGRTLPAFRMIIDNEIPLARGMG